jgi:hypothetical protein
MIIMTSPAIINITIIRTRVTSASPFRLAHPWQGLVRAVPNSSAVQLCRDTRWLKRSLHPDHVTNMFPVRLGGCDHHQTRCCKHTRHDVVHEFDRGAYLARWLAHDGRDESKKFVCRERQIEGRGLTNFLCVLMCRCKQRPPATTR